MSSGPAPLAQPQRACNCLNIRLKPVSSPETPPPLSSTDFTPAFVGPHGIIVTHPQVTLRNRSQPTPVDSSSRYSRYTSVTCLLCDTLVYQVHQIISIEVEGNAGPLLPNEEWIEQGTLKSSTGWVEVHRGALAEGEIIRLEKSQEYSPLFSVVLSPLPATPPVDGEVSSPSARTTTSPPRPDPPRDFMQLRPIFPPPPFTPTHPVFGYLASLAEKQSQLIRAAAEQAIQETIKAKVADVEQAEAQIRDQVENLWKHFRAGINKYEEPAATHRRHSSQSRERNQWPTINGHKLPVPPVSIRNFDASSSVYAAPRLESTTPARVSALSASLATSGFHHPRAGQPSPPQIPSPSSSVTHVPTEDTASSHTLASRSLPATAGIMAAGEGSSVLQFRRTINDSINTAVSYRYFRDIDQDMARHREEQQQRRRSQADQAQAQQPTGPGTAAAAGPTTNGVNRSSARNSQGERVPQATNENGNPGEAEVQQATAVEGSNQVAEGGGLVDASGGARGRGNRRVTFDVQPAVVTINPEPEEREEAEDEESGRDDDDDGMIFEIEAENPTSQPANEKPVLPLFEPAPQPQRAVHRRRNPAAFNNFSGSFSILRSSASLPAASYMRPRGSHGVDSSSSIRPLPRFAQRPPAKGRTFVADGVEDLSTTPKNGTPMTAVLNQLSQAQDVVPSSAPAIIEQKDSKKLAEEVQKYLNREDNGPDGETTSGSREQTPRASSHVRKPQASQMAVKTYKGKKEPASDIDVDMDVNETRDIVGSLSATSLPIPISGNFGPPPPLSLASYIEPSAVAAGSSAAAPEPHGSNKHPSATAVRKASYALRDISRSIDPGTLDFSSVNDDDDEASDDDEPVPLSSIAEEGGSTEPMPSGGRGRQKALKILQKRSEIPEAGMWRSLAS